MCARKASGKAVVVTVVAPTPQVPVSLTLAVNMEGLNVALEGVYIAGTWQGWDAGATPMTEVNGSPSLALAASPLCSVSLDLHHNPCAGPGTYLKYKFINGNAWGQDESVPAACADGIDRFHTVGAADEVLDAVCYGTCSLCQDPDLERSVQRPQQRRITQRP